MGSFIQFALVIGAGLCSVFEFVLVFLLTIQNFLHMLGMRFALAGFFCYFVGLFLQIVSISLQRFISLFEAILALCFYGALVCPTAAANDQHAVIRARPVDLDFACRRCAARPRQHFADVQRH